MSPRSLELELSRSLKLECWAIPALSQFPFFGKNSTLITWVGAVTFAGKRTKSLGFFNISMRLLIALCLNCLAVIADLWFRFLKEVSFQYWTYMTKNKNSDLRHGFNHPVWTPSFFLSWSGARPTILQIFRKVMRACVFPVKLINQACVIVRSDEQWTFNGGFCVVNNYPNDNDDHERKAPD